MNFGDDNSGGPDGFTVDDILAAFVQLLCMEG